MDFKPLVTLMAVVNPLACVPFFIHYTQGFTQAQRQRTIVVSSVTAFIVIAVSALLGLQILEFFGISLASFQVGGGMLLLTRQPGREHGGAVPTASINKYCFLSCRYLPPFLEYR